MNRILKLTAQILGAVVLLYIALMVFLYIFVQTKNFKPIITQKFYEKTGQVLRIDGRIKLSVFPWPGITLSNITIDNPKSFTANKAASYLIKVAKVNVSLNMIDLLHGNVRPRNILVRQANINLITAASGNTNWESLVNKFHRDNHHSQNQSAASSNNQNPIMLLPLPIIQVTQSNIHFINLKTNKSTSITNLTLRSPKSSNPMQQRTISLNGHVAHQNPNIMVDLEINTSAHFNRNSSAINFKQLHIVSKWKQINHMLKQPIVFIIRGNLSLDHNNFTSLLNGNFSGHSGSVNLLSGRQNGNISAKIKLVALSAQPVVTLLSGKNWIDGTANGSITLQTKGDHFDAWLANLAGNGELKISEGKIYGFNMALMVASTINRLLQSNQAQDRNQEPVTAFTSASTNLTMHHGRVNFDNFVLNSDQIKANGRGVINLTKTTIDAKLLAVYSAQPKWRIPITITGELFNPTIQPDVSAIAQQILKDKFKQDVSNTLDKAKEGLKKLFH